ncbi:MAG: glycosyltransferase [Flavobacteriales bacterium]|nr:glycosyltransferase [Flavobacteriales bacterium]
MTSWTLLALVAFALAFAQALRVDGWRKAFVRACSSLLRPDQGSSQLITVLVAARDAGSTLTPLLQDLYAQDHPRELVQVVVVDDHSADDTARIVERMAVRWPQLQLVRLGDGQGKKAAIMAGVKVAAGAVVLLTDADARCGPGRIRKVEQAFRSGGWDLLLLPVRTIGEGFVSAMQQEEQAALLGAAFGLWDEGRSLIANGANLAFRKAAFEAVGGYTGDRWASGDDVFLVQRMRRDQRPIGFLLDEDAMVTVEAERDLSSAVKQRLRWAGKMRGVRDGTGKLLAGLGMVLPWILFASSFVLATEVRVGQGWFFIWALMTGAWCAWLIPVIGLTTDVKHWLGDHSGSLRSVVGLIAFTMYAPMIAIASLFVRPKWKGRRV